MKPILLVIFALYFSPGSLAAIYKCKVDGQIVFTDKRCDGGKVILKIQNTMASTSSGPDYVRGIPAYSSGRWYYNYAGYQEALRVSRRYKAPLLLYFRADWCGYCKKLERQLFKTRNGEKAIKTAVKVKLSPEEGKQEMAFFNRLGLSGYPSTLFQSSPQSTPVKRSLTTRVNGKWQTKGAEYLAKMVEQSYPDKTPQNQGETK